MQKAQTTAWPSRKLNFCMPIQRIVALLHLQNLEEFISLRRGDHKNWEFSLRGMNWKETWFKMIEPCSSNCKKKKKKKRKKNRTRPLLTNSTFLGSMKRIKINKGKFSHTAQHKWPIHKGQRPSFASEVKRKEENLCLLLCANTGNNWARSLKVLFSC